MATLDWHCRTAGGVTLVELAVSADRPERVRIENCLDGPVYPPRTGGRADAGWDEDGVTGQVGPDGRLVLGYACPAEPAEPPARIVEADAATGDGRGTGTGGPLSARDVVRVLGDGGPPRDATVDTGAGEPRAVDGSDGLDGPDGPNGPGAGTGTAGEGPGWLDAVERRVASAERLAGADSVAEARAAVERAGGEGQVRRLRERLERDRERLAAACERCERLRRRAEAVEVPAETLSRIA